MAFNASNTQAYPLHFVCGGRALSKLKRETSPVTR
nr:MAG TPA: hypothetical protein [Bacteriophage sp.]